MIALKGTIHPTSFETWLVDKIREVLGKKGAGPAWILWCDPDREWLDLLRTAASDAGFEFWGPDVGAPDQHELVLRERAFSSPPAARVVWLPVGRADITWFKVFELRAEFVWEDSLAVALQTYGVSLARDVESDLGGMLAPHAREWFAHPKEAWRELTAGNAKGTLVSTERILEALAGPVGVFGELAREERFGIFARRVEEEFGLPRPTVTGEEEWRLEALARMLATEAAANVPQDPPLGAPIIPAGGARIRALDLLKSWQGRVAYLGSFEARVPLAEQRLSLSWWAKNLPQPPRSRSSLAVETVLLDQLLNRLEGREKVDELAAMLMAEIGGIQHRAGGFWAVHATKTPVGWTSLLRLAETASLLAESKGVEQNWRTPQDAVRWYTTRGWCLDEAGERLFVEEPAISGVIRRLRVRLRGGYLRATDRISSRFSELLAAHPGDLAALPTAGEIVAQEIEDKKVPLAIVFLDACRYDLGCRLMALLDEGEPAKRAHVRAAVAPLPSITALGMAFALPIPRAALHVDLTADNKAFRVTTDGFLGDLSRKEDRRRWLADKHGVQKLLSIEDVLDGEVPAPTKSKRILAVCGAEFDTDGHEGQLALEGADKHVARYAQAIRRLRDRGYGRIVVVTDHGFFHWQPAPDEMQAEKPSGKVLWSSRRAIVGTGLHHKTALRLPVSGSDLEAEVPRGVSAWKTYGGVGFFHGGATLQELVIPALIVSWPVRTTKVKVVLKPVDHITTRIPRVFVQVSSSALIPAEDQATRRVSVKITDETGNDVFRSQMPLLMQPPSSLEHREARPIDLKLVSDPPVLPFGAPLRVVAWDADEHEQNAPLDVQNTTLMADLDGWD